MSGHDPVRPLRGLAQMTPGMRLRRPRFAAAPDGRMLDLAAGRGPQVLIAVHSASCDACREYVRCVAFECAKSSHWGGRVYVIVPEAIEQAARFAGTAAGMDVLADPRLELADGTTAVVVADEWGEVYHACSGGTAHALPVASEVGEWVRFIAIQCPECEGPEGDWRRDESR